VENTLAIKYKGNVEEYQRTAFVEEYMRLFEKYKNVFMAEEKNNYDRRTWYRI